MSELSFNLDGWNDNSNSQRCFIIQEISKLLSKFYQNSFINKYPLQVCLRKTISCDDDLIHPCSHYDRSRICLTVEDTYWCQFIFQFSHELCHCTTSRKPLPQNIKWFDEFLCCFTSYFVLKQFERNDHIISSLYSNNPLVFSEYLNIRQEGHIYEKDNTQSMFKLLCPKYIANENLIKQHDVYYINFFNSLNGNYTGLSFIGKIHNVDVENLDDISDFFTRLKPLCNSNEIDTINCICNIFGIDIV